jgi:heme oxygenase
LLFRLSVATRQWHADVDDPWLELLRPNVAVSDYLGQLVRLYGLVGPFESALRYTPGIDTFVDVRQHSRAGLLAKDLLSLGLSASQVASVPACSAITTYRNPAEAIGWLYVVERSTLLQDGIRRHLLQQLPQIECACAYLTTYDRRPGEHWQQFGHLLERVGSTEALAEEVIAATTAGFDAARHWLRPRRDLRSVG